MTLIIHGIIVIIPGIISRNHICCKIRMIVINPGINNCNDNI